MIWKILFTLLILSPFISLAIVGLYYLVDNMLTKRSYKLNASKQHKMFSQLEKGDFVWNVDADQIFYRVVEYVQPIFGIGNKLCDLRIHFTNGTSVDIRAENAKTFQIGRYYTLMGEATAVYNAYKLEREKQLEKLSEVSPEKLKEATDRTIQNLERIKQKCINL